MAFFRQWVFIINILAWPNFSINFMSRIAYNDGTGFYILRNDRASGNVCSYVLRMAVLKYPGASFL